MYVPLSHYPTEHQWLARRPQSARPKSLVVSDLRNRKKKKESYNLGLTFPHGVL